MTGEATEKSRFTDGFESREDDLGKVQFRHELGISPQII